MIPFTPVMRRPVSNCIVVQLKSAAPSQTRIETDPKILDFANVKLGLFWRMMMMKGIEGKHNLAMAFQASRMLPPPLLENDDLGILHLFLHNGRAVK